MSEQHGKFGGVARIVVNAAGVPKSVVLDGVEIKHIARASVAIEPSDLLRLRLDVYVRDVRTFVDDSETAQ